MKKAINIILICVLAVAVLTVSATALRNWESGEKLTVTLNGQQDIYVEYGQDYTEPGATAQLTQKDVQTNIPVTVSGAVDTARVGDYYIKYTATAEDITATSYRCVHVVDTQLPVITLVAAPEAYTLPGQPYTEEGFSATDNYDGDLTERVVRKEKDGVVTYSVSDSSGNKASVTRTINYFDPGIPKIELVGGQFSFIMAGDAYAEPGYTATDKDGKDLTNRVAAMGNVDINTPGTYTLQYTVTNQYGKTGTAERTVYVIPKAKEGTAKPDDSTEIAPPTGGTTIEPNGKVVYLTFDDGPTNHTGRLLDVLAKYDVKATFFVVNTGYKDMITRAAKEGHTVAIHTYTHRYSQIYASDDAFFADLHAMQDVIYQCTGEKAMLTRFPGGSSNSVSSAYNKGIMSRLTKELRARGYQYFDWNVDSNDAGGARTSEEVFQNVIKGISNHTNSIVLQHDTQSFSVDAVERIIAWGLCNGYTFKALTADSPGCHHPVNN